jgi:hypothetical protein
MTRLLVQLCEYAEVYDTLLLLFLLFENSTQSTCDKFLIIILQKKSEEMCYNRFLYAPKLEILFKYSIKVNKSFLTIY